MPNPVPASIDVSKSKGITIRWADGAASDFPISLLRSMCPCAKCKEARNEKQTRKTLLRVLPGNYAGELAMLQVELVGNYAIKITWSDAHDTGIYSFAYLRELAGNATSLGPTSRSMRP